jgi:putative sterol carrier protein
MSKVKEKADLQKLVIEWVGPFDGKILQVTTEEGAQYMIIRKEEPFMTTHQGTYPSPDVIYRSTSEILLGIFTGEVPFKQVMAEGTLEVIGNANESDPLANLILAAMMGM